MEIGEKLKNARIKSKLTQEKVAEEIQVSRQTISNWENNHSYPDIISVIKLSDFYHVSLDELLKGDVKMIEHLDDSTNIVNSNKKLIIASTINIIFFFLLILFNTIISAHKYLMICVLIFSVLSTTILFYQIIRKF